MSELKKLSSECDIDNLLDSLIKDMIVCANKDNSLRGRLLRECEGRAAEETRNHAREILREI